MSIGDLSLYANLGSRRWIVPVLGAFKEDGKIRFAQITHRLSLGSESLKRTLDALILMGWVERNTGYGHPLRPEYLLTDQGVKVSKIASDISIALCQLKLEPSHMTRWSYPLLVAIMSGNHRFSDLEAALQAASPRALTQSLKKLVESGLVLRTVENAYPPQTHYALAGRGRMLAKTLVSEN